MPDYQQGKIYQIWSPNSDKVYIGSTVQHLHKRMYDHKHSLTGKSYTTALAVLGCGDARIELIEEYSCANKAELNRREGQIMRGYDNRVNRCIAGRTRAEHYVDNKEHIAEYGKQYRQKPEVRARDAARHQRPEVKAKRKEFEQRPEVKEKRAEYLQKPEVKARRAAWAREYRLRKKEQLQ